MKKLFLAVLLPFSLSAQEVPSETYTLTTPTARLEGTLTRPPGTAAPVPVVLFIAGSGATDRDGNGPSLRSNAYRQLAEALAARGVAVLRYDKRGVAASRTAGQREEDMTFDILIDDAQRWVDTLRQTGRFSKLVIAGHSEGSLVGMMAARRTAVEGYISVAGAGRNIAEVLKTQLSYLPDTLRNDAYRGFDRLRSGALVEKPNPLLYNLFRPSVQPYLISWMRYTPADEIKKLTLPCLIIQGGHDLQVPLEEARLLKEAQPQAQLRVFDDMNHLLKDAPAERNANLGTYNKPELPITPGLAEVLEKFIKAL
ncbi:alpha/beta hydrolase [Rhabdobacter roseus]|uniref:Serine aminopeptidase S33 domain-containing protein n=1 Tax=Rhabdobacter roseus TaxID=1655419 RepID=A0A840TQ06_9BACT|nr:alpha/beta fold hydrolase [Rhabdobacter roseus]MBB5282098.1 hypothetical protein [Rhabdobacter roseus]